MRSTTAAQAPRYRLPAWAVAEGSFGIRLLDVGIVHLVIVAIEINVIVGNGPALSRSTSGPICSADCWRCRSCSGTDGRSR
ncbi:MAG: hypothetical protein ACRDOH_15775 [Streptosporangiaceae bacterium]